jgi:hypothetical protein
MSDHRTDRIAAIAERLVALEPLEPVGVRLARAAHRQAQDELHRLIADGAEPQVIDATRYRVLRAHDLIEQRWHDAAVSVAR